MKSMKGIQHVYLRADDWGVIFYSDADRLVYYTTCAVKAREYSIKPVAAAIMFTHVHQSLEIPNLRRLSKYIQDTSSSFARQYNWQRKQSGAVFHKAFGRSWKRTDKDIRGNLAYVYNNHVEKQLCEYAQDCRWSFLAYANSTHPFSQPVDLGSASRRLLRAMKIVTKRSNENAPLKYRHVNELFNGLNEQESEQLKDFIIVKYALIDFRKCTDRFGGYEKTVLAFASTTGSEYKMAEESVSEPDTWYIKLLEIAQKWNFLNRIGTMPAKEKRDMMAKIVSRHCIPSVSLEKFFHYSPEKRGE